MAKGDKKISNHTFNEDGRLIMFVPSFIDHDILLDEFIDFLQNKKVKDDTGNKRGNYRIDKDLYKDKFNYVIGFICSKVTFDYERRYVDDDGFREISSKYIKKALVKDYKTYFDILINKGYIESKEEYKKKISCKAYKLIEPDKSEYDRVVFNQEVLGKKFSKHIKKLLDKKNENNGSDRKSLINIDQNTYQSTDEIYEVLKENYLKTKPRINDDDFNELITDLSTRLFTIIINESSVNKDGKIRLNKKNNVKQLCNLFLYIGNLIDQKKQFEERPEIFKKQEASSRIYTKFSSFDKDLRPLLTTQSGERLGCIDLRASQLFLFSTMLNNDFYAVGGPNEYSLENIWPTLSNAFLEYYNVDNFPSERNIYEIHNEYDVVTSEANPQLRPMRNIRNEVFNVMRKETDNTQQEIKSSKGKNGKNLEITDDYIQDFLDKYGIRSITLAAQSLQTLVQNDLSNGFTRDISNTTLFLRDIYSGSIGDNEIDDLQMFGKQNNILPIIEKDFYYFSDIPKQDHINQTKKFIPCKTNLFFIDYTKVDYHNGINKFITHDFNNDFYLEMIIAAYNADFLGKKVFNQEIDNDTFLTKNRNKFKKQVMYALFDWIDIHRINNGLLNAMDIEFPGIKYMIEMIQNLINPSNFAYLLQRIEAYVMLEKVSKAFLNENPEAPLITLHDGLYTTAKYLDSLAEITQNVIQKVVGKRPGVSIDQPKVNNILSESDIIKLYRNDINSSIRKDVIDNDVIDLLDKGYTKLREIFPDEKYDDLFNNTLDVYVDRTIEVSIPKAISNKKTRGYKSAKIYSKVNLYVK